MSARNLQKVVPSVLSSDGAGVKLRRSLGASQSLRHDPFLMLDEFGTDNPDDYIGGFPPHPHRGFETVTYMLDGHMQHKDHMGNTGDLGPGNVQWMTAGRGVIHSEMPRQTEGRMRGFQLWINLPAKEKMQAAEIPTATLANGGEAKVIAGTLVQGDVQTRGPIHGLATEPLYFDIHLPPLGEFEAPVPAGHNAFVYVYEGQTAIGDQPLPNRAAGLLSDGDRVQLRAGHDGARLLLLAGKPLNEPVVQYGPFVMNTREEIERAVRDYQNGELTSA